MYDRCYYCLSSYASIEVPDHPWQTRQRITYTCGGSIYVNWSYSDFGCVDDSFIKEIEPLWIQHQTRSL